MPESHFSEEKKILHDVIEDTKFGAKVLKQYFNVKILTEFGSWMKVFC